MVFIHIGLAIAGEGGVASSKPIATAVVGPGGLAVAKPIATAIAGISASEVSALGIPIGSKFKTFMQSSPNSAVYVTGSKKYGLAQGSGQGRDRFGILVGPDYQSAQTETSDNKDTDKQQIIPADEAHAGESTTAERDIENADRIGEEDLTRRLTSQENALVAALNPQKFRVDPFQQQSQHHQQQQQLQHFQPYAFAAQTSPFHYNWQPQEQQHVFEQPSRYEPYSYFDNRASAYVMPHQFYPFQQANVLPVNPYQFRQHY